MARKRSQPTPEEQQTLDTLRAEFDEARAVARSEKTLKSRERAKDAWAKLAEYERSLNLRQVGHSGSYTSRAGQRQWKERETDQTRRRRDALRRKYLYGGD